MILKFMLLAAGLLTVAAAGKITLAHGGGKPEQPVTTYLPRQAPDRTGESTIGPFRTEFEAHHRAAHFRHDPGVVSAESFRCEVDPDFAPGGHTEINRGPGWYVVVTLRS